MTCESCGHDVERHGPNGCTVEVDKWISGINCDGLVAVPCGCMDWESEVTFDGCDDDTEVGNEPRTDQRV